MKWMWLYARTPFSKGYLQATAENGKIFAGKEVKMHHTKQKADVGLARVISDLVEKGYVPCIPLSEHQAYDLVAVNKDGVALRVQVKYASLKKNGTIEVRFRRNWADKHGTHTKRYLAHEFEYYAIYCPEKEVVLYIPNGYNCPKAIRFDQPKNNQLQSVKWAKDFLVIKRESSETIRHTPEKVKT
ncbi:MAG: group I intron-associated PD-(D/E)XK endonuclease [Candidatus Omnitrophota bacterium]